jgi:hypothetical protein
VFGLFSSRPDCVTTIRIGFAIHCVANTVPQFAHAERPISKVEKAVLWYRSSPCKKDFCLLSKYAGACKDYFACHLEAVIYLDILSNEGPRYLTWSATSRVE